MKCPGCGNEYAEKTPLFRKAFYYRCPNPKCGNYDRQHELNLAAEQLAKAFDDELDGELGQPGSTGFIILPDDISD